MDRAVSIGSFSDDQRAIPAPPSDPQYLGLIEYRLSWALTDLKRKGLVLKPSTGNVEPGADLQLRKWSYA